MNITMPIKDVYIANPVFPYTYFPISDAKDRVDAMLLYTEKYKDPKAINSDCMLNIMSGQYIGELKPAEIDTLTAEIKTELKLQFMDWGYIAGRCLVTIGVKDLPLIYQIVKAFVSRGRRVYMQDTTQTTFPAFCEPSYELQQKLILELLTATLKAGFGDPFDLYHAPVHRSKFWSIPAGQELAKKLRELTRRKDERSNFVGEFFAEGVRKPEAAADRKDEPDAAPVDKKDATKPELSLHERLRQVMPASVTWQGRQISVDDWDFDRNGTHYGTMGIDVKPNTASITEALVAGLDKLPEFNSVGMPKSMITICRLAGEYLEGGHSRGVLVFLGYASAVMDKPGVAPAPMDAVDYRIQAQIQAVIEAASDHRTFEQMWVDASIASATDKKDAPMAVDKKDKPVPMELNATTCCICLENPVETMVLPCEHAVICRACSNKLKLDKNNMHKCVSCGQQITQVVD